MTEIGLRSLGPVMDECLGTGVITTIRHAAGATSYICIYIYIYIYVHMYYIYIHMYIYIYMVGRRMIIYNYMGSLTLS